MATAHVLWRGNGAVVRVVEQQDETPTARAQPTNGRNQFRIIPFVDNDEIGAPRLRGALFGARISARAELRIGASERVERLLAMILDQVHEAPRTLRLEHSNVMPALDQL